MEAKQTPALELNTPRPALKGVKDQSKHALQDIAFGSVGVLRSPNNLSKLIVLCQDCRRRWKIHRVSI